MRDIIFDLGFDMLNYAAHMLYNVRIWMRDELAVCEMKYAR
jgi:hypothetical protein